MLNHLKALFKNKDFVVLFLCFAVGLSVFNAFLTLIQEFIAPSGYTDNDAGAFGGILLGAGVLGSMIAAPIMDRYHNPRTIFKAGVCLTAVGILFVLLSLKPDNFTALSIGFAISGACLMPLMPVAMECAAECTYPVGEDISTGFLMMGGCELSVVTIYLFDYLINLSPTYTSVWTPASITFLVCISLTGLVAVLFFHGKNLRLAAEQSKKPDSSEDGSSIMGAGGAGSVELLSSQEEPYSSSSSNGHGRVHAHDTAALTDQEEDDDDAASRSAPT